MAHGIGQPIAALEGLAIKMTDGWEQFVTNKDGAKLNELIFAGGFGDLVTQIKTLGPRHDQLEVVINSASSKYGFKLQNDGAATFQAITENLKTAFQMLARERWLGLGAVWWCQS